MSRSVAFRSPNWLGDSVMATVVPAALARAESVASVTVLTPGGLGDVFAHSPNVDETLEIEAGGEVDAYRAGGYDLVLLGPTSLGSAWRAWRGGVRSAGFSTEGRSPFLSARLPASEYRRARHQVENYRALAALAGEPDPSDEPRVVVDEAWRAEALARWPRAGRARVALQPGATFGPAKRWASERFAEIAGRLIGEGYDVAVLGGPGDRGPVERVVHAAPAELRDLSGASRVGVLAGILESADLLITNDTGPMHLAAAVGSRCLALFGSTSPTWTAPRGPGHQVLSHRVECSPCFLRECRIGYPCLEGIEAERVLHRARRMLEDAE